MKYNISNMMSLDIYLDSAQELTIRILHPKHLHQIRVLCRL